MKSEPFRCLVNWRICRLQLAATTSAVGALSPALNLFLAVQIHHNRVVTCMANWSPNWKMQSITSWAEEHATSLRRCSSRIAARQQALANLHLRKRWPPSSSSRRQHGQSVSMSMPRRLMLVRSGRLLCVNLQRNIAIFFGTFRCQIFPHCEVVWLVVIVAVLVEQFSPF